jgi:hypothetical protein
MDLQKAPRETIPLGLCFKFKDGSVCVMVLYAGTVNIWDSDTIHSHLSQANPNISNKPSEKLVYLTYAQPNCLFFCMVPTRTFHINVLRSVLFLLCNAKLF